MLKQIKHLLLAGFTYYLFGKFGLTLAIPPGFASAVWPATGGALACVLMLNRPAALLGIAIGSFILNLGITSGNYATINWTTAIPAGGIAIGTTLQALVGTLLFTRLLDEHSKLETPNEIMRFLLIVGPLGCLIAPSIGVTTLYLNDVIAAGNFAFSWITWWVGDTIGILLFTPLFLVLFSTQQQLTLSRKLQIAIPTVLIFIAVLQIFYASTHAHNLRLSSIIDENAQRFFRSVEERVSFSENTLRAYEAFYQASSEVTREEFNDFSKIILRDDEVFQGIGWTEIVQGNERKQYEEEMQKEGFADFTFTEFDDKGRVVKAPDRSEYYPVIYIYPQEQNGKALGLNLAVIPSRYKALLQATLLAKPIATEPIKLAQEVGEQRAIIMYYPVFRHENKSPLSPKPADKIILGFISGVIRVSGLVGNYINEEKTGYYAFKVLDVTNTNNPIPLYLSSEQPLTQFLPVSKQLSIGGRLFDFSFYPTNQFQSLFKDWNSWIILTVGFLVASLLQALFLMITGTTENIRREVERKTHALQLATKAAEQASQAKSQFTANISHEIRTPLNAIVGLINMTLKSDLNETQRDYLQKAKLASTTLTSLINSTLDFSKIEAGKIEIEHVPFDISESVSKIRAIFTSQAIEKNINFILSYPDKCPRYLIGDPLRIEQILLNLCSNAFKFTDKGSVRLEISVIDWLNHRLQLEFKIIDSGIGIAKEQQKSLFESFYQADSSTSRKYGGTGLGLAISKNLIELMDGNIYLESQQGEGSQFVICIPLEVAKNSPIIHPDDFETHIPSLYGNRSASSTKTAMEKSDDSAHALMEPNIVIEPKNQLSYISILLVEDLELNQLIAQAMLEEYGADVTVAHNGVDALEKLATHPDFDLILMDIQMPEMDGYEATRKIRSNEKTKSIPILAMTANVMKEDIEKCLAVGMNGHIGKPLESDELLKNILALLPLGEH